MWILLCLPSVLLADQWVRARLGSFETVSDSGRKSAITGLSQFEQFRNALGVVMGQPDLRLDPPLRILVFKDAKEMAAQGCAGMQPGRDHLMACTVAEGQLSPDLVRELTKRLLEANFSSMPAPIEQALENFFSTVQSNAVHVTWGAPPPPAQRTREWALLHRLITQPDYAGRAHIYLHNLASGMDSNGALRSLSEDPAKFNAEVDRYFAAGVFNATAAPSRPLNPDRDFTTTNLTSDEGQLARADLLNAASAPIYQSLLKSGRDVAEANEGLGLLALRAGDAAEARRRFEAAREHGTRNAVALTAYGASLKNPEEAATILKEALGIEDKYAPAHWALGEKLSEPRRRLAEWKQAVTLAPRNYEWLERYARLCEEQKQYADAGHAWLAAAQAAPDPQNRDRYLALRSNIDQLRLADEDAIRRREAAAKAAEIERLKFEARQEIARIEANANSKPLSGDEAAKAVAWSDTDQENLTAGGTLTRIECAGKQFILDVRTADGKVLRLLIADPARIETKGGELSLRCGAQKPREVSITYKGFATSQKGLNGEVSAIETH